MTYRDSMRDTCETLGWCKCLSFAEGRAIITKNGPIIGGLVDGKEYIKFTPTELRELAKKVNPYYDDYKGYDDKHILLDAEHEELPCCDCPWFEVCEAMSEEI